MHDINKKEVDIMAYFEEHSHWGPVVLRVLLGVAFIVAGLDKILRFGAVENMFQNMFGAGTALPLLYLAIAVELIGGLMLLFGWKVRAAAGVLAVFILVAFIKTFALGATPNAITTLREIMVMNTGGGNTAVNYAYFAGLLALVFSSCSHRTVIVADTMKVPRKKAKNTKKKKTKKKKKRKK